LVSAALVLFVAGTYLFAYRPFIYSLATAQLENVSQRVDSRLRTMIRSVEAIALLNHDWGLNGTLSLDDPERFNQMTAPFMTREPNLSSIAMADDSGREILLMRTSDGQWVNRFTNPAQWGAKAQLKTYNENWQLQKEEEIDLDYDVRTRPWYQAGLSLRSDQNIHWTEPSVFHSSQEPGFSAIVRWSDAQGINHVLSSDLKLIDVSRFTRDLTAGKEGYVVVLSAEGALLGLPRDARLDSDAVLKENVLKPLTEAGLVPLNEGYRHWRELGSVDGKLIQYQAEGKSWLAVFHSTHFGDHLFWVGTLAPEADFHPVSTQLLSILIAIALGCLLLTWFLSNLYAKRFSKPLERLSVESARMGRLELDQPVQVTSKWREIASLAVAQESMRLELLRATQKLAHAQDTLETQVIERTQELEATEDTAEARTPMNSIITPIPIADETSLLLSHAKVLLAEGNPLNQEVAVAILNEGGISVDVAENGQIAIEKIAHNHYDAVLMDLQMPVMDGLTVTKLIREIPAYRKLPIIAMTVNVMKADLDRCRQAGMNDHIAKPIDASRLWQVLKKWIPIQSHPQSQEKTTVKETAHFIPNLSRLPELDFKGSVRRLGGRESSYLKILQIFVKNHLHAVKEIQQSLKQGNTNLALQQIHTLKGVAAQIGAQLVEAEVTTLERAIQNRASASVIESLSTSLALHFEMLIEQLHENLPSPPPDLDKL